MIQVIKRQEGLRSSVTTIERGRPQISYNSDGHLVIRVIHDSEKDTLVVLDAHVSDTVIDFIRKERLPF